MKVVFLKNNNFKKYDINKLDGYHFKPRNKSIKSLIIIKEDFIKYILIKKIKREIMKVKKTIKLIINSNVTIIDDCIMMENEIIRISKKLEERYRTYFDEFQYFDFVKGLYLLYSVISYKKKVLNVEE